MASLKCSEQATRNLLQYVLSTLLNASHTRFRGFCGNLKKFLF